MSNLEYEEYPIWNLNSFINYTKDHFIQILLLIFVFIIIYIVDHISNINALLYGIPSAVPGTTTQNNTNTKVANKKKSKK